MRNTSNFKALKGAIIAKVGNTAVNQVKLIDADGIHYYIIYAEVYDNIPHLFCEKHEKTKTKKKLEKSQAKQLWPFPSMKDKSLD